MEKKHKHPLHCFTRIDFVWLGIILILALTLRLYKIQTPLADWHSWRQVDTASVARNFVQNDFNLLYPKFHDLSNIQSGHDNPQGYRFVEFPLYNAAMAAMYKYLPVVPLEIYGRLITVFFSLIIISIIYYLTLHEHSRVAAIVASLLYATFPFFVYYSRVVLPETTALGFIFLAIFLLYHCTHLKSKYELIYVAASALCAALAILIKPTAIFYLLPVAYLFFTKYRFRMVVKIIPYLYVAAVLAPLILWRLWIAKFPEGIPQYEWLITSVETYEGRKPIFFKPAFFRWIFYERIPLLIFGGYAALLPLMGMITKVRKSFFLHIISLGALVYLLVFQGGNVQHDYYQTMILPALAIMSGIGAARLLHKSDQDQHFVLNIFLLIFILGFSWTMSYYRIRDYYNYSEGLINVAKIIETLTPRDALVVTDSNGDTTLLYLAKRRGMPAVVDTLEKLKGRGMQYFYADKKEVAVEVRKIYTPIFENGHVFIFKL